MTDLHDDDNTPLPDYCPMCDCTGVTQCDGVFVTCTCDWGKALQTK